MDLEPPVGGKDHFAADRVVGDQVKQVYLDVVEVAVASRAFLDLGVGLPTGDNTHEVVQSVEPASKIVYMGNDPLVLVLVTSTTRTGCWRPRRGVVPTPCGGPDREPHPGG